MKLFSRRSKVVERPPGLVQMVESYGDYLMGDRRNFDQKLIGDQRVRSFATGQTESFIEAMLGAGVSSGGAALGACELLVKIYGRQPSGDAWNRLMSLSVLYLKAREVPWSNLKDYQRSYLRDEGIGEADW